MAAPCGAAPAGMIRTEAPVFEISRDLYRELKPMVIADSKHPGRSERVLLAACEQTIARLARDLRRYPRPARHLFANVRFLFPVQEQLTCYRIIERHLSAALDVLEAEAGPDTGRIGALRCASINRKGRPCGREPLRGSRFCPSHKHLEAIVPMPHQGLSVA
jgi:hypothetical protein